ncbi:MAG TPA: aminotransferase class I/II-fold pyridoxal phosphate-dependent enzyme [Pyrinomonadaceae bacterium]|nr:aminotransferase class I/II-fold pyridoxal phosphate-dependent enzyme [Pyrinomonadaceae bacterium]
MRYLLDFASSLYLGQRHPSRYVPEWEQLSTGKPAVLATPPGAPEVSRQLALLQNCENATVATSTLHLFWDLFGILASRRLTIYVDAETYPIALWGVERARARGACVHRFAHHDAGELFRMLGQRARAGCFQVVVTDGFCIDCGRAAPLSEYMKAVQAFDGLLVVDDTQALGIFGERDGRDAPYGTGGGGLFRWYELTDSHVVAISSLAKGFGVPIAALVGSDGIVRRFTEMSETNIHCSPPSAAVLNAARRALEINVRAGDELRRRLAWVVTSFKRRLDEIGLPCLDGLFPVQTLDVTNATARSMHLRLQQAGLQTILRRGHTRGHTEDRARLSFIITARHRQCDIDHATNLVSRAWKLEARKT